MQEHSPWVNGSLSLTRKSAAPCARKRRVERHLDKINDFLEGYALRSLNGHSTKHFHATSMNALCREIIPQANRNQQIHEYSQNPIEHENW